MSYTAFAISNKGKVRALAIAMDKRHPLLPDVPTLVVIPAGPRATIRPSACLQRTSGYSVAGIADHSHIDPE